MPVTTRGTRPIFDSNAGRGSPSSPAPSSSSSLPFPSLACNSTARLRLCNKIRRDLLWIISTLPDHTRERELDFSKRFLYYRVYSLEEEEKRTKERFYNAFPSIQLHLLSRHLQEENL